MIEVSKENTTESNRLLDLAEEGIYKKVKHKGCSDSNSVGLYQELYKVNWHCFKCKQSGVRDLAQKSIKELLEIQKAKKEAENQQQKAITDFTTSEEIVPKDAQSIPMDKRDWLYEAGFSNEVIDYWGTNGTLYYTPSLNRVGMKGHQDSWTQLRSIDGSYPKYLNRGGLNRLYTTFLENYIILVEDWLSALRLHNLGIPYLCLFGTNLKSEYVKVLVNRGVLKTVFTWLDNDIAGIKGAKDAKKSLEFYTDLRVINIHTNRDPKMYSNEEIQGFIDSARSEV